MSRVAELLRSRRMPQVAVLTLMSVGFAGCSADMQTRFSDFSNPFASQPEATGSVRSPAVERREPPQFFTVEGLKRLRREETLDRAEHPASHRHLGRDRYDRHLAGGPRGKLARHQ